MYTLVLLLSHAFLQSSCLHWLFLPIVGRVLSLCCYWASLGCLGLELGETKNLLEMWFHRIAGYSPSVVLEKPSMVDIAYNKPDICPHCTDEVQWNWCVCGYLPLFLGQELLWSGSDSFGCCLYTAMLMVLLWINTCRRHVGGRGFTEHGGKPSSVSKDCSGLFVKGTWSSFSELLRTGGRRWFHRKVVGRGMVLAN